MPESHPVYRAPVSDGAGKLMENMPENPIWAKSRKYKMVQTQKIHAEVNAENTSGSLDEAAHGGGRPTSCGPLVCSACASACIFCFCPIQGLGFRV